MEEQLQTPAAILPVERSSQQTSMESEEQSLRSSRDEVSLSCCACSLEETTTGFLSRSPKQCFEMQLYFPSVRDHRNVVSYIMLSF